MRVDASSATCDCKYRDPMQLGDTTSYNCYGYPGGVCPSLPVLVAFAPPPVIAPGPSIAAPVVTNPSPKTPSVSIPTVSIPAVGSSAPPVTPSGSAGAGTATGGDTSTQFVPDESQTGPSVAAPGQTAGAPASSSSSSLLWLALIAGAVILAKRRRR